jgi:hypothetical protein
MKIIDKLKSLNPFKKKNKEKTIQQFVLEKISAKKKRSKKDLPENLTEQEWLAILDDIAFGFKVKQTNTILKSPTRKRQREQKVKRAFELFEVYIKYL